jgi:stage II sporulation protein AA (anti-sigma F factor antagonist)
VRRRTAGGSESLGFSMSLDSSIVLGFPHSAVVSITLHGRLDYATAQALDAQLKAVLETREIKYAIFNLDHVKFMDTGGLGPIVRLIAELHSRGGGGALVQVNPSVLRLLTVTGTPLLVFTTEQQAMAHFLPDLASS